MRSLPKPLIIGVSLLSLSLAAPAPQDPVKAARKDRISLLETIAEWKYPGSQMPDGASISDGLIGRLQAVKCKTVLTTPDPIEKVIAYYAEKFGAAPADDAEPAKAGDKQVSVQDDSRGRPVKVRVFVVNQLDSSTTLVISRAEGEKETHVAWSHYLRLADHR